MDVKMIINMKDAMFLLLAGGIGPSSEDAKHHFSECGRRLESMRRLTPGDVENINLSKLAEKGGHLC